MGQDHGGGFRTEEDRELTAKVTGSENPAREQRRRREALGNPGESGWLLGPGRELEVWHFQCGILDVL